ncbi:uncharacterized protein LOC117146487 [Drosophila mauritiana]|uniref:Uncharacterized protein LOC117146487 n=1 Tax=Drosophila mauritiana TaxID=7226 RepID=A0A6P8KI21_DROMA|nr:uncharacterized protein LOC117146487 [Drosophila mauritiana]
MIRNDIAGIELTSGPTGLRSRIIVRNLPDCTRHELAYLCIPFGRILGSLIVNKQGFIQFSSESEATRAINALDKLVFRSKILHVSNASFRSIERNQERMQILSDENEDVQESENEYYEEEF